MNFLTMMGCLFLFWAVLTTFVLCLFRVSKRNVTVHIAQHDGHPLKFERDELGRFVRAMTAEGVEDASKFSTSLGARELAISLGFPPSQVTTRAVEVEL